MCVEWFFAFFFLNILYKNLVKTFQSLLEKNQERLRVQEEFDGITSKYGDSWIYSEVL